METEAMLLVGSVEATRLVDSLESNRFETSMEAMLMVASPKACGFWRGDLGRDRPGRNANAV